MATKTKTEIEEPEVTAVTDEEETDIPVSDEVEVDGDNLENEEFYQISDIGDDEDEVADDEISEDM